MALLRPLRSHRAQRVLPVFAWRSAFPVQRTRSSASSSIAGLAVEQGQLLIALPIKNGGDTTAIDVRAPTRIIEKMSRPK